MLKPHNPDWQELIIKQFPEIADINVIDRLDEIDVAEVLSKRHPALCDGSCGSFTVYSLAEVYIRDAQGQVFLREHPKMKILTARRQAKI